MGLIGYLRDFSNRKRLRLVKPGKDANNENLSPNDVIFDSESNATLMLHARGSFLLEAGTEGNRASWSSLGYAPLVLTQFEPVPGAGFAGQLQNWLEEFAATNGSANTLVVAYSNRLWIRYPDGGSTTPDMICHYQVYRLRVQS